MREHHLTTIFYLETFPHYSLFSPFSLKQKINIKPVPTERKFCIIYMYHQSWNCTHGNSWLTKTAVKTTLVFTRCYFTFYSTWIAFQECFGLSYYFKIFIKLIHQRLNYICFTLLPFKEVIRRLPQIKPDYSCYHKKENKLKR